MLWTLHQRQIGDIIYSDPYEYRLFEVIFLLNTIKQITDKIIGERGD